MAEISSNNLTGSILKIVIVDDHPIFREGLRMVLSAEEDIAVCGEAGSAPEGVAAIEKSSPDVVLIDLTLEKSNGMELLKDIRFRWKDLPVIVLTNHDETLYAERCMKAGANGYLMKHNPPEQLIEAIHAVSRGELYLSKSMTNHVLTRVSKNRHSNSTGITETLSDRELQVFELYGKGKSTRQIADDLSISNKTVESHREHIKAKLNISDPNMLIRTAIQWVEQHNGL